MLQLPATRSRARHFTKAEILDITRGAKVVKARGAKADPIIDLIAKADRAMDRHIKAANALFDVKEKLAPEDRGSAHVYPIDETAVFREFGHGYCFTSEAHIGKMFRLRRRHARNRIAQSRNSLKNLKPGHRSADIKCQLEASIDSAQRLIAALLKFEEPQKRAFREEERRLRKIQTSAGLLKARAENNAALKAVRELTLKIAKLKPASREGALAVILYVGERLFPDRYDLFTFDRGTDGEFTHLLRAAHAVLAKTSAQH